MAQDSKTPFSNTLPNPRITAIEDQLTAITNTLQGLLLQPQPAVPLHHYIVRPQVSVTDPYGSEVFSGQLDKNFDLWVDWFIRLARTNRWTDIQKRQFVLFFFWGYAETRTTWYRSTHTPTISPRMMFWLIGCVDISYQREVLSCMVKPYTTVASNQESL